MRKLITLLILSIIFTMSSYAQEFEWIEDNTSSSPGERIIAILDAKQIGSYTGVEIIGQVIDNMGNWGYNLPIVADFKLYVKFSGGLEYDLVQTVETKKIVLGLRKVSDTKVHLVANCPFSHMAMRVIFKQIAGAEGLVSLGNPDVVTTEGDLLMSKPKYTSGSISASSISVNNGNNSYGSVLAQADESNFQLYTKTLTTQPLDVESFRVGLKNGSDERNGFISFYRGRTTSGGFLGFSTNGIERIIIDKAGNVAIGKTTADHKLDVAGTIRAEEILVEAQTADFVFDSDYNLLDLSEVENFIKENKHLPEIPSAAQMEKQGVNLAEMNKLLLQKVEELTLYMIDQQKQLAELKSKIDER